MTVECIITGCDLVVPGHMRVHGDLHVTLHAYIFNAVLTDGSVAAWEYNAPRTIDHGKKLLIVADPRDMFERRGVIVVAVEHARLTEAAREYVNRAPGGTFKVPESDAERAQRIAGIIANWPRDIRRRLICDAKHPMPQEREYAGETWVHVDARESGDGAEVASYYCPRCDHEWRQELPE